MTKPSSAARRKPKISLRSTTAGRDIKVVQTLNAVFAAGLVDGPKGKRLSSRAHAKLFDAAARRSGLASESELIEYALAKVALEDDFAERLLARSGTVDPDLNLEF